MDKLSRLIVRRLRQDARRRAVHSLDSHLIVALILARAVRESNIGIRALVRAVGYRAPIVAVQSNMARLEEHVVRLTEPAAASRGEVPGEATVDRAGGVKGQSRITGLGRRNRLWLKKSGGTIDE